METHVKVIAILYLLFSGLLLVGALLFFLVMGGIGLASGEKEAMMVLGTVGTLIAGFCVFLAIPGIIAGIGLLKLRPWARILTIILAFLDLLSIPIGTALGIYALIVMFKSETVQLFRAAAPPPGGDAGA